MKDCTLPAPVRKSETRRHRLAAIMLVLLLTAFLGGSRLSNGFSSKSSAEGQPPAAVLTEPSEDNFHYFRSGQWLADLRSLVAACKYLLQPDWA
jgi:hypothetical protein